MTPTNIALHKKSRVLEVTWADGEVHQLSCEFLRVNSPSAEVQGHGIGQGTLQIGKEDVNIKAIEPIGNYAVQLVFDDNHDSGLYSWDLLRRFGETYDIMWENYLEALKERGYERKKPGQII
jgi:DUF971 family protein